jgi:hypothetical protein
MARERIHRTATVSTRSVVMASRVWPHTGGGVGEAGKYLLVTWGLIVVGVVVLLAPLVASQNELWPSEFGYLVRGGKGAVVTALATMRRWFGQAMVLAASVVALSDLIVALAVSDRDSDALLL